MGTSNTKDTTTSNTTDPWAPQAAALSSAFGNAQNAYNQSAQAVAPTNFTAQMTPAQLATFQQMISQGGNQSVPTGQAATGDALQTEGRRARGRGGIDRHRGTAAPTLRLTHERPMVAFLLLGGRVFIRSAPALPGFPPSLWRR